MGGLVSLREKILSELKSLSLILGVLTVAFVITLLIFLLLFNLSDFGVSFAAIAGTLFMIFTLKSKSEKITYDKIFIGYAIASGCGFLSSVFGHENKVILAISLIMAIILMVLLDKVHTPAVAFVISFGLNQFSLFKIILILLCIYAITFIAKTVKFVLEHPERFYMANVVNKGPKVRLVLQDRHEAKTKFFVRNKAIEIY
jgi:hypothetical protein